MMNGSGGEGIKGLTGVQIYQLPDNSVKYGSSAPGGEGTDDGLGVGSQMMKRAELNPQYEADKAATSVQEKYDMAQAGNNRRLSAMGVDPSSGRSRALNRNAGVALAAAKAGAANKGRRNALLDNWSRMSQAAGLMQRDESQRLARDKFNYNVSQDNDNSDIIRVGPSIGGVRKAHDERLAANRLNAKASDRSNSRVFGNFGKNIGRSQVGYETRVPKSRWSAPAGSSGGSTIGFGGSKKTGSRPKKRTTSFKVKKGNTLNDVVNNTSNAFASMSTFGFG